jgi:hydroxymethylpyrimidine pyrophosphatase-like HAD family hydrolase
MREYTIKKVVHKVYESLEEVPSTIVYLQDWRLGEIGDWVLADDGAIIQILRSGELARPRNIEKILKYIGTCTGTYIAKPEYTMDTDRRENIYTVSGKLSSENTLKNRKDVTPREAMFAQFVAMGMDKVDAYLRSYKTDDKSYAKMQANILVKTERIRTALKEELKPLLAKLNINEEFVLSGIKEIAELGDKDSDKLKALLELSDVLEMKESKKEITAIGGAVFKGFLPEQTEIISDRPKLKE